MKYIPLYETFIDSHICELMDRYFDIKGSKSTLNLRLSYVS